MEKNLEKELKEKAGKVIRKIIPPSNEDLKYRELYLTEKNILTSSKNFKEIKFMIMPFFKYLESPTILDAFESDKERNNLENLFYKNGNKTIHQFYKTNKIRATNIRNLLQLYGLLKEEKIVSDNSIDNLISEIWGSVSEGEKRKDFIKYENSSEEEKIKIAEKTSLLAKKVCEYFIKKYPINNTLKN